MAVRIREFGWIGKVGRGAVISFFASLATASLAASSPPGPLPAPESGPTTDVAAGAAAITPPTVKPEERSDAPRWERLEPTGPPSPRFRAKAVYETDRQRLLLVGGYLESKDYCNETWEHDGRGWKKKPISGPPAGSSFCLTYDQRRGVAVFFGGKRETWEYDGKQWKTLHFQTRPPVTGFAALAYDVNQRVCALFGGETAPAPGEILPQLSAETWQYDGFDWVRLDFEGPAPRKYHQMVYDAARRRFVLFGGFNRKMLNDTWELRADGWREVKTRHSPSPRRGFALTYDPIGRRTLLFGGHPGGDELWEFDGTDWGRIMTKGTPPPREGAVLAYIPTTRRVLLFGGLGQVFMNDTWEFRRGPIKAALPVPPLEPPRPGVTVTEIEKPEPIGPPPILPGVELSSSGTKTVRPEPVRESRTTETAVAELHFEGVRVSPRHLSPTTILAFRGKLHNTGGTDAECWVECWLSKDREPFSRRHLLCRSQRVRVSAGRAYDLSLIMRMPYDEIPPGQYYLGLQVDRGDEVPEQNEGNNIVVLESPYTIEK